MTNERCQFHVRLGGLVSGPFCVYASDSVYDFKDRVFEEFQLDEDSVWDTGLATDWQPLDWGAFMKYTHIKRVNGENVVNQDVEDIKDYRGIKILELLQPGEELTFVECRCHD